MSADDPYFDNIEEDEKHGRDPEKEPPAPNDWPKVTPDKAPAEPDDD